MIDKKRRSSKTVRSRRGRSILPKLVQKMRNIRKRRAIMTRKVILRGVKNQRREVGQEGAGGGRCPWEDARAARERSRARSTCLLLGQEVIIRHK